MRATAVPGSLLLVVLTLAIAVSHAHAAQRAAPPGHDFGRFGAVIHRQLAGHIEGGYAFIVTHGGAVVASGAFGWARTPWEHERPGLQWTLDTTTALASVSKTITAVSLLHLWDERQHAFSLDAPFWPFVEKEFPDARPEIRKITIRQLLMHRSGIPNPNDAQTIADVRALLREPLEFTPGSRFAYHNNNYLILRFVLEQIARSGYTPYVKQHVLGPMGITKMDTRAPHPLQSSGYLQLGQRGPSYPFDWDPTASAGAAGWYGSVHELSAFLLHLRDGRTLSDAAWKEMWKDALGWDRQSPLSKGGDFGWNSAEGSGEMHSGIAIYPDDVQAVLLLNCAAPVMPNAALDVAWRETKK
jgi:CubicO group peptidase (beta-lactamase class C family)